MTIRTTFQPSVDEFISTLEEFATGSYLKEDEKEFWDEPFDIKALPELRSILEKYLDSLDKIGDSPDLEAVNAAAQSTLDELEKFNTKYHGAVVEPEEKEEISQLMFDAAKQTGADDLSVEAFPEFE
ncbi:hypothetical protein N24_1605 [Corynebacterium suranareeae]|uniref:Uncharacterized protein n=1 Tax=Corynebacterium suranareeae TaxID=2506452 RepID=A0A160PPD3_9CORY|nr:hypothetical protein [Corynebacterium suranareeae]BAU95867.1 hypothetical protein N24_1605 [Corynebacterium suranareeae]